MTGLCAGMVCGRSQESLKRINWASFELLVGGRRMLHAGCTLNAMFSRSWRILSLTSLVAMQTTSIDYPHVLIPTKNHDLWMQILKILFSFNTLGTKRGPAAIKVGPGSLSAPPMVASASVNGRHFLGVLVRVHHFVNTMSVKWALDLYEQIILCWPLGSKFNRPEKWKLTKTIRGQMELIAYVIYFPRKNNKTN